MRGKPQLLEESPELRRWPHGIRAPLEEISVSPLGTNDAAGIAARLEKHDVGASLRQGVGAGEARQAASDDRDAS